MAAEPDAVVEVDSNGSNLSAAASVPNRAGPRPRSRLVATARCRACGEALAPQTVWYLVLSTDPPEVLQELTSCDLNRQRCIRTSCGANGWIGGEFCYVNVERSFAIMVDFEMEQTHARYVESYLQSHLTEQLPATMCAEIAGHDEVVESFGELARLMEGDRDQIDEFSTGCKLIAGRTRFPPRERLDHL